MKPRSAGRLHVGHHDSYYEDKLGTAGSPDIRSRHERWGTAPRHR